MKSLCDGPVGNHFEIDDGRIARDETAVKMGKVTVLTPVCNHENRGYRRSYKLPLIFSTYFDLLKKWLPVVTGYNPTSWPRKRGFGRLRSGYQTVTTGYPACTNWRLGQSNEQSIFAGRRRPTQTTASAMPMSRVLPGKRLEAVQGGAGFAGLQNLFFRCSFRFDCRRDFARRPRRGRGGKSPFSVAKTTFVKSLLRRRA